MTKYQTVEQVAEQLQVHWQTVLELIKYGDLPAIRIGKSYRIDPNDLGTFLQNKRIIGATQLSYLYDERVKEIINSAKYKNDRLIIVGFCFQKAINDIFSEKGPAFSVLTSQDALRDMGWDLDLRREQPKPTRGDYLGFEDKVRFMRIYRDGLVLAGGLANPYFLGWQGGVKDFNEQELSEEKRIHALAAAELIANFTKKSVNLAKKIGVKGEVVFAVTISNPRINKIALWKSIGSPFPPDPIGESFQEKEKTTHVSENFSERESPELFAGSLWKEFCYMFGILDEQIPWLKEKGQMNFEQISKIK